MGVLSVYHTGLSLVGIGVPPFFFLVKRCIVFAFQKTQVLYLIKSIIFIVSIYQHLDYQKNIPTDYS